LKVRYVPDARTEPYRPTRRPILLHDLLQFSILFLHTKPARHVSYVQLGLLRRRPPDDFRSTLSTYRGQPRSPDNPDDKPNRSYSTSYSLVISDLTPNAQYEWQVRVLCSGTESSGVTSSVLFSTCGSMYTVQSGSWNYASTWSCGRVPTATDAVQVKHAVQVPIGHTATAQRILYDPGQRLLFGVGARVKIGQ
jgi:hypothetical protein